eukprot:jgi/Botrbrau1/6115/Bobra.331_2s0010.1
MAPDKKTTKHIRKAVLGAAAAGVGVAYHWKYTGTVKRPDLYYQAGKFSDFVLERCPSLLQPYRPTYWATNGHVQSALGVGRHFYNFPNYHRQLLVASDGGTVAIDWFRQCDLNQALPPDTPVLVVFHGLTGGSHEGYCKGMCSAAYARGWRSAVFNYRGCAGLPLTSPKTYSAAFTDDAHMAVEAVQQQFPDAPLFAVGFSLGSVILTKYLAEADSGHWDKKGSGIAAACMISSPFCLHSAAANLSRPWSFSSFYNRLLAFRLKQYFQQHKDQLGQHIEIDAVSEAYLVQHFDHAVIIKLFGYADVDSYYRDGSSAASIPQIRTPSLFVNAADDPFLGKLPVEEVMKNPHTMMAVTHCGGHIGFLEGLWPFGRSWVETAIMEFMQVWDSVWSPNRESKSVLSNAVVKPLSASKL